MKITLPYPPSANRYWRTRAVGRGRTAFVQTYPSPEAKEFKQRVFWTCRGRKPLTGTVAVVLRFFRPRKVGDLDNRIKVLLDALRGVAFADDDQVVRIEATRFDDKANPRVEVEVDEVVSP